MANATDNLTIEPVGHEGRKMHLLVGTGELFTGIMASQLDADATLVPGSTASSGPCIGVVQAHAAAAAICEIETDRVFRMANATGGDACSAATPIGWSVYMYDDHTIADNSSGGTREYAGVFMGMDGDKVLVHITPGRILAAETATNILLDDSAGYFDTDNVEAALAQIVADLAAVTATHGANMIGYQDSGNKTSAATVDEALDEFYVDALSAQKMIPIPLVGVTDADGDPIVKFVDGDSETPGFALADSKAFGIRWNNKATHAPVLLSIPLPQDLDDAAAVVLHVLASKTGATLADATTFTLACYFQTVGALHDADTNAGGATSAMTGDAAAKTVQEVTRTIAASDVPASPSVLTLSIQPTNGTLATDDVVVEGIWFEYTSKLLTS